MSGHALRSPYFDEVLELLNAGHDTAEVAEATGATLVYVSQIKSRYVTGHARRDPDYLIPDVAFGRDDLEWTDEALCAQIDPELFFPEKGGTVAPAKQICRSCPVTAECLDMALRLNMRFGIWGGLSERERRKLEPGVA